MQLPVHNWYLFLLKYTQIHTNILKYTQIYSNTSLKLMKICLYDVVWSNYFMPVQITCPHDGECICFHRWFTYNLFKLRYAWSFLQIVSTDKYISPLIALLNPLKTQLLSVFTSLLNQNKHVQIYRQQVSIICVLIR